MAQSVSCQVLLFNSKTEYLKKNNYFCDYKKIIKMPLLQETNIYLSNLFAKDSKTGRVTSGIKNLKYSKEKKDITRIKANIKNLSKYRNVSQADFQNYNEYMIMDSTYPIIKAALDIYSEEATSENFDGKVLTIHSDNQKIKDELENLFYKVLKLNYNSHLYIRNTCKYGNTYCLIDCDDINGVKELIYLRNSDVRINPYNLQDDALSYYYFGQQIEPWQIVHWRNIEDLETFPYGVSTLRPIVETWRRVVLMREALIIYRITRAPSRYLFKIDVTGLEPEEAERMVNDIQKETTKQPHIDFKAGSLNQQSGVVGIEENIYVPIDENSQTSVETLEGASNLDQVEDYKIIKDDLFAGLKIPKAWLSFEEELNSKSTLAGEDSRFSRTTQKIQRQYIEGLTQIASVHLYHLGYSEDDVENFEIKMYHPNTALKEAQLEMLKSKIELFKEVWDKDNEGLNPMSFTEASKSILDFSQEEVKKMIKQQFDEKKIIGKIKKVAGDDDGSGEDSGNDNSDGGDGEELSPMIIKDLPDVRIPQIRLEKKKLSLLERVKRKGERLW